MSVAALKVLRDAVKTQRFDGVYYVAGDDAFQQEDAVRQFVRAAVDPATRDFNLDTRSAASLDVAALDTLLNTPPIMADRRVIVIRDVGLLKKDVRKRLDAYLTRPSPDTVLILVASAGVKPDAALSKMTTPLVFEPLSADRIPRWITHYAESELSTSIAPKAAELLHAAVGEDLHLLAAELDKLTSYTSGREIDEAAVLAIVGVQHGELLGSLLDAIGARDVRTALPMIPIVLGQPKVAAVPIVMALSTQFLMLGWARARLDAGLARSRLANELFAQLKRNGGMFTGRPWGNAVSAWVGMADRWESREIDIVLMGLVEADVALKESRVSGDEQLIEGLVLRICGVKESCREAA